MHDTLSSLVERALTGNQRLLEFYLREHSGLPGGTANLDLANDLSHLLAATAARCPEEVWSLVTFFTERQNRTVTGNSPAEFVLFCGLLAAGTCAAVHPEWQGVTFTLLQDYARSGYWRVRAGVAMAYQHLLNSSPRATIAHLYSLVTEGNRYQKSVAMAAVAETPYIHIPEVLSGALEMQRLTLQQLHEVPAEERKKKDVRTLRTVLGYTLSVITEAAPDQGFALMRECITWDDVDIRWVLRENLRKKRLAGFADTKEMAQMLA